MIILVKSWKLYCNTPELLMKVHIGGRGYGEGGISLWKKCSHTYGNTEHFNK